MNNIFRYNMLEKVINGSDKELKSKVMQKCLEPIWCVCEVNEYASVSVNMYGFM